MIWRGILFAALLAGCAQLPLTPADIQARRFEARPDKAVIYLVRDAPDFSDEPATVWLDDSATVTLYPGTYYRWEAEPGNRRIAGFGGDSGSIALQTRAGGIYFVQQRLSPFFRFHQSHFQQVSEPHARAVVARSVLAGGQ